MLLPLAQVDSLAYLVLVLLYHGELISAFGSGEFLSCVDYVRFASVAGFYVSKGFRGSSGQVEHGRSSKTEGGYDHGWVTLPFNPLIMVIILSVSYCFHEIMLHICLVWDL